MSSAAVASAVAEVVAVAGDGEATVLSDESQTCNTRNEEVQPKHQEHCQNPQNGN